MGRGVDLIVVLNRKKHRIKARSVELLPPLPQGAEVLAADVTSGRDPRIISLQPTSKIPSAWLVCWEHNLN